MKVINCWEFINCQRQPGGLKAEELGVCPASELEVFDGVNNGKNGGRYCWRIAGTFCDGKIQGSFASKIDNCLACDFFKLVFRELDGKFRY